MIIFLTNFFIMVYILTNRLVCKKEIVVYLKRSYVSKRYNICKKTAWQQKKTPLLFLHNLSANLYGTHIAKERSNTDIQHSLRKGFLRGAHIW
jgi:hypothetical protein